MGQQYVTSPIRTGLTSLFVRSLVKGYPVGCRAGSAHGHGNGDKWVKLSLQVGSGDTERTSPTPGQAAGT